MFESKAATFASLRQAAAIERNAKFRFERKLLLTLRAEYAKHVRKFARSFSNFRMIPDFVEEQSEIAAILLDHYLRVHDKFGTRLRRRLPTDIAIQQSEVIAIQTITDSAFPAKAMRQAELIMKTTVNNMIDVVGNSEELSVMLAVLNAQNSFRARFAACYETQWSAESSKQIEAMILTGHQPEVKAHRGKQAIKTWDSMGDVRVRDHHLEADGIQVPVNQPYTVNNEKLMHPGDTSLGASANNVLNCRCSSITNMRSVITARQDLPTFIIASELDLDAIVAGLL